MSTAKGVKGATKVNAAGFPRTRALVLPVLKKKDDEPINVRIETPMAKSKVIQQKEGKAMDPATVCTATNLETGELCNLICNSVLESTLNETFPGDGYVGKCLEIIQHSVPNKRYKTFEIYEIEA